jgi:hypothetical protein
MASCPPNKAQMAKVEIFRVLKMEIIDSPLIY